MIIRIRNKLLKSDQNDSFALLFKYPHVHNIRDIIILSFNIYQFINERIKGKVIQPQSILQIAESLSYNDKDNDNDINSNMNEYQSQNNNLITPFSNSLSSKRQFNNSEKDKNEFNIKNNFIDNQNNYSNNKYEQKSLIDDAILSLGKIGNKLKDQFKVAKDALGFDIYEDDNNINLKKENKMSDLFDIPNFSKEKENNEKINNQNSINYDNRNKKDYSNIIERLKRIDNKYNKYFDEEDKTEIENIIKEILK
jgi:hypothetical protein